jgi:MFS family permease
LTRPRFRLHPLDGASAAGFLAYSASASIVPIALVILLREIGEDLAAGGMIDAVRNIAIFAVLFMSGLIAARWGKARSIGLGAIAMGLGLAGFAFAPNYPWLLAAAAFGGLGAGMLEGLINPLVQDLHPRDSGRYLNFINGFWSIGVLATMLGLGELLTRGLGWRTAAGALAAFCIAVGILFLALNRHAPATPATTAGESLGRMAAILRHPRFWLFAPCMALAGGAEAGYMFWSASWIQLEFAGLPREGGIGAACFAGGMIAGRFGAGWLVGQRWLLALLVGSSAVGALIGASLLLVSSLGTLYVGLFAIGLAAACLWPSLQSYAAEQLPVDSTMLFILLSCAGIPGFAATVAGMGWIGDRAGLATSFAVLPGLLAALAGLLLLERRWLPLSKRPA